jgi:hypothetical protein
MPGQKGSLQEQVKAAELALRHIARLHSHQGQRPQQIAQRTLHKMTMLARQSRAPFEGRGTSSEGGQISTQLD